MTIMDVEVNMELFISESRLGRAVELSSTVACGVAVDVAAPMGVDVPALFVYVDTCTTLVDA